MKQVIGIAIAALLLLALPANGATVGQWKKGYSGTGNVACAHELNVPGDVCAWTGAAGNAPMVRVHCGKTVITVTGTLSVKPYKCVDGTLGNCEQLETTNDRTGVYGAITLDATDWYGKGIPFGMLTVEYVSGAGDAIIECGG